MAQQRKDFDEVAGTDVETNLNDFLKGASAESFTVASHDIIAINTNTITGTGYVVWEDNV